MRRLLPRVPTGTSGCSGRRQVARRAQTNGKAGKKAGNLWGSAKPSLFKSIAYVIFLAERVGFEPTIGYSPIHAFQACAFNRSAISPRRFARGGL